VFYSCYQAIDSKKTRYFWSVGLVIAFCYTVLPPSHDAYRYYFMFQEAQLDFLNVGYLSTYRSSDILYALGSLLFKSLGLNFYYFRYLLIFSAIACWIAILNDILKKNPEIQSDRKLYLLTIGLFFLAVNGFRLAYFMRYLPAVFLMTGAYYMLTHKSIKLGIILAIAAPLLHFSTYSFLLVLLGAFFLRNITFPKVLKIVVPIILLCSSELIPYLLQLPGLNKFSFLSDTYISGYWYSVERSWRHEVYGLVISSAFFVSYYYYATKESCKGVWSSCVLLISWLCFAVYPFFIVRERFIWFGSLILLIDFCMAAANNPKFKKRITLLIVLLLLGQICNFYAFRREATNSVTLKSIVLPGWSLPLHFYDELWMMQYLNDGGDWLFNPVNK